nr:uncharacterized protein LOC104102308 [Nicotiana tomentosiformis]
MTELKQALSDSFQMLADSFIKSHAGARKVHSRKADIFRIAQGESELLRDFVTRLKKERMLLSAVSNEWAVEPFTKGLNSRSSDASRKLKESFLEFQATTWADVHNWYESKMRIEDDQLRDQFLPYERAEGHGRGFQLADRFATDRRVDRSRNNRSLQDKEISCSRDSSYPRLSEYNFNVSVVELVLATRNIKESWFPKPMRSDPNQRDLNLWCEYHGTNGHRTRDCRHLREEMSTLLKNDHLREFLSDRAKNIYDHNRDNAEPSKVGDNTPHLMINMIFRGNEINGVTSSAEKKTKVSVTHSKRLWEVVEDDITFTEEDVDGLLLPHNDALKFGQYYLVESVGARQAHRKYHSGHKAPRRVQFDKLDNPGRDPGAHECRGGDEDDPFRDMTGIPPDVVVQKLSMDPNIPPVRQRKRPIAEVRKKFVKEEVLIRRSANAKW